MWVEFTSATQAVKGAKMRVINRAPHILGRPPEMTVQGRLTSPSRIKFEDGGELLLASAKSRYKIKVD